MRSVLQPPAPTTPVPTIHVTIGRIEVRAVTPEPRPGRSIAASAPRLSLEDYLRARGGATK